MASKHTKIPRAITEFKLFLDYNYTSYNDAAKHIKSGEGWVIPFYSDKLFLIVSNLEANLYEGIYPKLLDENPASDEEITNNFKGSLSLFEQDTWVFDAIVKRKKEKGEEAFLSTVEGIVQELLYKAIYKLKEVIQLAQEDIIQYKNSAISEILDGETKSSGSDYSVAIVTATLDEYKHLKQKINTTAIPSTNNDTNTYEEGHITGKNGIRLHVIIGRTHHQGVPAATNLTTKLILRFRPKMIVMLGHLAGNKNLKTDLNIGDVVICKTAIDYDNAIVIEKKAESTEPIIELKGKPNPIQTDSKLIQLLENMSLETATITGVKESCSNHELFNPTLSAHSGKLISGDALVRSEEWFKKVISENPGAIALDMETFGFYYASEHTMFQDKPIFVSIKSVSDFGGSNKHLPEEIKDHHLRVQYAVETSINFFLQFVKSHLPI